MFKKIGFTLAEVLIVLGIIGVVAALTIPALLSSTGDLQEKTAIKKLFAVLNQSIEQNYATTGNDFSTLTNGINDGSIYAMFMSTIKITNTSDQAVSNLGPNFNTSANYTLYFADGMVISFPKDAQNCTSANYAANDCTMVVDVNGPKQPNSMSTLTSDLAYCSVIGGCAEAVSYTPPPSSYNDTHVTDEFLLDFYDRVFVPHDAAARYAIYGISGP